MKNFLICSIFFIFISCNKNKKAAKINKNFRPHIVRHVNKSKIYFYYHIEQEDCISVEEDLYAPYQHSYKNYVQFTDNQEIIWEQ